MQFCKSRRGKIIGSIGNKIALVVDIAEWMSLKTENLADVENFRAETAASKTKVTNTSSHIRHFKNALSSITILNSR